MNQHLQAIADIINQAENFPEKARAIISDALKSANKELEITAFKLERTEKVKRTTAILLEETIEELEQKRKAIEAQNRELEIEAALERVRGRTMAMHQTSELQEVIHIVHKELMHLNLSIDGGSFVMINEDVDPEFRCWGSGGTANTSQEIYVPHFNLPFCTNLMKGVKKGPGFFTEEFSHDEKIEFFKKLFQHKPWSDLSEEQKRETLFSEGGYTRSVAVSKHTSLFIINHVGRKFTEAENDILKRFGKVFEQTYARFLDLKKAETQAREAQIGLAVERVRVKALAMHRSDEIHEVVRTLRHELFGLNLEGITGATICLQQRDGQVRFWDITDVETTGRYGWDILFDIDKLDPQIYIKRMWAAKDKIIAAEQDSDDLKRTLDWLSTYDKKTADGITKLLEENHIQHGWHRAVRLAEGLLITDFANVPPSEIDNILLKIGSAFDLAYTRFQDLQNAEAQAREAQIEAALERIRATTMAMHKSDELLQTSQVLFDQFKQLGEHADQLTIGMINESEGVVEIYATVQGEQLPTVFRHPISDPHVMSKVFKVWKAGERSLILELSANELESYNRFRNALVGKQVFTTHIAPDEKRVIYCSYFSKGMLAFGDNVQPRPETRDILDRFSKVFDQTYTRFLDLQKAEAHAKQAEKDLVEIKTARQKAEHALAELQATQQQLIQSEKMASLGELTAGIAHEIQNPLNFVNNFSELNRELLTELKEELGTGNFASAAQLAEDIEGNEEKINFHGKRADSIVKSMLQHSKVSTGTKEPTDINALAEEFLRLSFHGFRAKDKSFNVTVDTTFDKSIGKVEVMPQDIGRVLLNLFNNSFYAVNEKKKKSRDDYEPVVQVITVKTSSGVEIKVKDNGTGIPEKVLNKIYQPFFTTKPTGEGTGLGLSLSYDIITKGHGGDMKVHTKEGEGSTFIVELPA